MIINIRNGADLFTLDVSLCQIRYCHDIDKRGKIDFIPLSTTDAESYKYLYENDRAAFVKCIEEDYGIYLSKEAA